MAQMIWRIFFHIFLRHFNWSDQCIVVRNSFRELSIKWVAIQIMLTSNSYSKHPDMTITNATGILISLMGLKFWEGAGEMKKEREWEMGEGDRNWAKNGNLNRNQRNNKSRFFPHLIESIRFQKANKQTNKQCGHQHILTCVHSPYTIHKCMGENAHRRMRTNTKMSTYRYFFSFWILFNLKW